MPSPNHVKVFAVTAMTLLVLGCGGGSPDGDRSTLSGSDSAPPAEQERAGSGSGAEVSATRVALPGLFSIMVELQGDMARISRGLWIENFDTIAAGADAIANHPRVPQQEFQRISEVLGSDMSRFGGMDREVHDLAVRLAEEARSGELEPVLSTDVELRRGCVACHTAFRDRLREAIER